MLHENYRPDYVMLLQPTSPLRTADDIDLAVQLAIKQKAEGVISVCETHQHPYLMTRIAQNGTLVGFMTGSPESGTNSIRRQELPSAYFINGAIYLIQSKVLLEKRTLLPTPTFPYIMPQERSFQIDEPGDLHLVDLILRDKLGLLTHQKTDV
jgi:N-acylneuraminate cytidylyltransferase/CMP-N,N'-diacetyllegionaminic acid synthase